jgi:hypothetical protein
MIWTELITEIDELKRILPDCLKLAKAENLKLPFQYSYLPIYWGEVFTDKNGKWFSDLRGTNFFGMQSRLEKFYVLIVRDDEKLIGCLPLARFFIRYKGSEKGLHLVTLAGDYMLHPFQDFIVASAWRLQVIQAINEYAVKIIKNDDVIFWVSYLPQNSPNIEGLRKSNDYFKRNNIQCIESISCQRGGVWPWTIKELINTLKKMHNLSIKHGDNCDEIQKCIVRLSACSVSSLVFKSTRDNLKQEVEKVLASIGSKSAYAELISKINLMFTNTPILYPYIDLPSDREKYMSMLSYSTRRYLRRYMRAFTNSGGAFEEVMPHNISDNDIDQYINLHLLRWGRQTAAMCGESVQYHKKVVRAMAGEGLFRLFFAIYQGKRIAVHSCFDINDRREGYVTGLDQNYRDLRVGRLLYLHTIMDAIDNRFKRYELGVVASEYKRSFAPNASTAHGFFMFSGDKGGCLDKLFLGYECQGPLSR